MKSATAVVAVSVAGWLVAGTGAFSVSPRPRLQPRVLWSSEGAPGADPAEPVTVTVTAVDSASAEKAQELKDRLLRAASSTSRSWWTADYTREEEELVNDIVQQLAELNPTPDLNFGSWSSLMRGTWRLVFTDGFDTRNLNNPLQRCSKVSQWIEPPMITNVLDLEPKLPGLFAALSQTRVRQKVVTRAKQIGDLRLGLKFEAVEVQPLEVLGNVAPANGPSLKLPLPQPPLPPLEDLLYENSFFDVIYLDDDLRIQKTRGRTLFVAVRESFEIEAGSESS